MEMVKRRRSARAGARRKSRVDERPASIAHEEMTERSLTEKWDFIFLSTIFLSFPTLAEGIWNPTEFELRV
jgi:hypothetical protein